MPENNQILSVESQLVGLPLAGPVSFSPQQLDYLKRALGVDETVLWEGTAGYSATLSESLFNFKKIKVFQETTGGSTHIQEFYTSDLSTVFSIGAVYYSTSENSTYVFCSLWNITNSGVTLTSSSKGYGLNTTGNSVHIFTNNSATGKITRVIGIGRISGGN